MHNYCVDIGKFSVNFQLYPSLFAAHRLSHSLLLECHPQLLTFLRADGNRKCGLPLSLGNTHTAREKSNQRESVRGRSVSGQGQPRDRCFSTNKNQSYTQTEADCSVRMAIYCRLWRRPKAKRPKPKTISGISRRFRRQTPTQTVTAQPICRCFHDVFTDGPNFPIFNFNFHRSRQ